MVAIPRAPFPRFPPAPQQRQRQPFSRVCERCGGWRYLYDLSPRLGAEWACLQCGGRLYQTWRAYQLWRRARERTW